MVPEVKRSAAAVVPASTMSTAVLGANSIFEPASEFSVDVATESPLVPASEELRSFSPTESELISEIAETAHDRADQLGDSPMAWVQAGFAALASNNLE